MKFAPIVPTKYVHSIGSLSDYQLALAHMVLKDKVYADAYRKLVSAGYHVLLDNSACELGTAVSGDSLVEAYERIGGASIVTIPDTDGGRHRRNHQLFEEFFKGGFADRILHIADKKPDGVVGFMAVPWEEVDFSSFISLRRDHNIKVIGLNRGVAITWSKILGARVTRIEVAKILKGREGNKDLRIHMLGLSKDPMKEIAAMKELGSTVVGVDSSLPYRILRTGRTLKEFRPHPPHIDFGDRDLNNKMVKFCHTEMSSFIKEVEK